MTFSTDLATLAPSGQAMPIHPEIPRLIEAISGVYRGNRAAVDLLVIAYLAGGHVLLEDIPGVGKTTLARALAQATGGRFRRLQCTPDLMPADITGVSIYDERDRQFVFHPGPLFCDVLLADELNRTPPRTQSALLEAMSEGQVTIEGEARTLTKSFFCIATQNPSTMPAPIRCPTANATASCWPTSSATRMALPSLRCLPKMALKVIWRD